jgi:hypothetical protein
MEAIRARLRELLMETGVDNRRRIACLAVLTLALCGPAWSITPNQLDDFEDGTTQGWAEGIVSPNPPVNIASGGPAGANDSYLSNEASGVAGPGGNMVMFNLAQWTGDYIAAGVRQIEVDMANLSPSATLIMHFSIESSDGTRWGSTTGVSLPADGQWRSVVFPLNDTDLARFQGTADFATALSDVVEARLVHTGSGPTWSGVPVVGTLGVDNVRASLVPVELRRITID